MKVVEYIRGITSGECRRLRELGIVHTIDLVHASEYAVDRRRLSEKAGIPEPRLLALVHEASLIEISGLDERYLQVLRRLGIVSMRDLGQSDDRELHERMIRAMGLAGAPSLGDVQYWISQARQIDILEEEELPIPQLSTSATNLSAEAQRQAEI